jgi:hypothetical protein
MSKNTGMSSEIISGAAEGATKAALDWSADRIRSLVKKLRDRKLAFICDEETIAAVREEYNSGEAKFYETYIEDRQLLFQVRMGLALRRLEKDKKRLQNLRERIYQKYRIKGLHIAEFVQTGILHRYIGLLIGGMRSLEEFKSDILELLLNVDKHVLFVQDTAKAENIIRKAANTINANSPDIFVVSGMGEAAKIADESGKKLEMMLHDYKVERISGESEAIFFFKRIVGF